MALATKLFVGTRKYQVLLFLVAKHVHTYITMFANPAVAQIYEIVGANIRTAEFTYC
jgi:hypothetical protein